MPTHLMPVSRRTFIAESMMATVVLQQTPLPGEESISNPDVWALLSDTHLLSARSIERHYRANKPDMEKRAMTVIENFGRASRQVNALPEPPAGLILNGDCVHVGGNDEYSLLASQFEALEKIPLHVTMGNHDHRNDFSKVFRERWLRDDRVLLKQRHVSVLKSRHANLVLLDSLTMQMPDSPVKGPGILGNKQLGWLESVLDSESDKPAIVMFHHNIDPSESYQNFSGEKEILVESASDFKGLGGGLEDTDPFLDLLQSKPHVKAVITGHMHQFRIFKWRKVYFISLPSVGYTFDPREPVGWIQLLLQKDGAALALQTLDSKHARHGSSAKLRWS